MRKFNQDDYVQNLGKVKCTFIRKASCFLTGDLEQLSHRYLNIPPAFISVKWAQRQLTDTIE